MADFSSVACETSLGSKRVTIARCCFIALPKSSGFVPMSTARSPNKRLRKAVLPVAGLGTRVLPATKAIPKEMLPVFDRPAIQYVVDEALAAGIEHIVFVIGRNKMA